MRGIHSRIYIPSGVVAAIAFAYALFTYWWISLTLDDVLLAYFFGAIGSTFVAVMVWVFHQTLRCMFRKADNPLGICLRRLKPRAVLLILPAIISPIFLTCYTTGKACIHKLALRNWDATFIAIDRAIFGVDPWIITHHFIGPVGTQLIAFLYMYWGGVLVAVQALIVLYGRARLISRFYMTMFTAWLLGGVWLAVVFASGGPAFAHLFDPSLHDYFQPLLAQIPADSDPGRTQAYLAAYMESAVVKKGGGISAMPSMHMATVVLYVLAARGTGWFWPAVVFAVLIWIGSVHLAYHYAIDGVVSAIMVVLLWRASGFVYDWMLRRDAVICTAMSGMGQMEASPEAT